MPWFDAFRQDLTHSLRMFRQNPGFTAAALAALALGIGANTAIFSVVNAVLLKPVPFPDPDRIVVFLNTSPDGSGPAASPAKFRHWRQQSTIVQDVTAYRSNAVNLTGTGFPEQLRQYQVSADYFRLFGVPIVRGRAFTAEEDLPNAGRVVLISHNLWTRRFGSDPGIIGRTLSLGGDAHTVVGIVAPEFNIEEFGLAPDLWVPFQLDPNSTDQGHYFTVAGRLKSGVTLDQAKARLRLLGTEYRRLYPNAIGPNDSFGVEPMRDVIVRNVRASLYVLVGAVGFVLLIACANVANLLLVRATGRRREIAVRAAIGAGRGRIVRQLLTESVLLSVAGGIVGLALGVLGIRALLAINTAGLPRVGLDGGLVGVDLRVLGFALLVAVLTGIVFGLFPAFQGSRTDLTTTLNEVSGRSGSGFRQNKARAVLVVAEVALALTLLVGSALLIRTSVALGAVEPGFDTTRVLTMEMSLNGERFAKSEDVEQMIRNAVERIRTVPGVETASAACCLPLQGGYGLPFVIVGRPLDGPSHGGGGWLTVSPGYFDVFRIPVKRGRAFTDQDTSASIPVVMINEAMARQFWPKGDPLTDRLVIGRDVMKEFAGERERQIIGIVGDVRDAGLNNDPGARMYIPQAQVPDPVNVLNMGISTMKWVVRTRVPPHSVSQAVQEQLRQTTGLPVSNVRSMEDIVALSTSRQRFNMWLMTVFGASALLLSAIGIYGLMAYSVAQRTQEMGIRLALGAQTGEVRRMVVSEGMVLAIVGVVLGLGGALALTKSVTAFSTSLFRVDVWDPLVFVTTPLALMLVALIAVWFPARRASRVDPIEALRYE
jgi:putative ABC transport system permease protein